ncbi:hypothetical protein HGRIS_009929 [Hohenbuehelia grisea]|uniref:HIT-type domain-containing protein n=1 Tax=Hohenbuehelia grisea TaxID=104357 RepID=A0ABR3J452_9AGAR
MVTDALQSIQLEPDQPEASSSSTLRPVCFICHTQSAIYTCPRCTTRTCSLPCSNTHKTTTGCTGQRDKVAYVPMNEYGYGTMMNDYVFLEDLGRKAGEWGKDIARSGYSTVGTGARGRGMDSRGRGRGHLGRGAGAGARPGRTKRDILKLQLELRDIDVELLPNGMERRKLNQSVWDFKKQTAFLTIQFKFHPPRDPTAPSSQACGPSFSLVTHRNNMETSLLKIIQTQVSERAKSRKDSACPPWLSPFVCPDPDDADAFQPPCCVMRAPAVVTRPSPRGHHTSAPQAYFRLDPALKLSALLRHTSFVEFPTIEVHEEFSGPFVDASGEVADVEDTPSAPKRRKLNAKAGKAAIAGLLGGYGSEDDEDGSDSARTENVLSLLGGYQGSDGEDEEPAADTDGDLPAQVTVADAVIDEGDESEEEDVPLDPNVLLELIKSSRADHDLLVAADQDEKLDWNDSADEQE